MRKTITIIVTLFLLINSLFFYGQGCPDVPHIILNETKGFSTEEKTANDHLGTTTKSAGDINGDGIAEIMIGTPANVDYSNEFFILNEGGMGQGTVSFSSNDF